MHNPQKHHFEVVFRVLRYLKGTVGLGITFRKQGNLDLLIYTDSDFAGCLLDFRSTMGYCTFLDGNLVTWRSKKQNVVSKSSTEVEFRAISKGIDEILWLRYLLQDLRIPYKEPIQLLCDNKSAIYLAHDPLYHDRVQHVDIDRFYIREQLDSGMIDIKHIRTEDQCANVFTKGLLEITFTRLISKLGMKSLHSCT